jgi:hypothetical protein
MRGVADARRLAIVVLHPRFVEFSIRHLVTALADAGFTIVALSSRDVPSSIVRVIESAGGIVVGRAHVGRDIGAYQDAIRFLHAHASDFSRLEQVVLANDSVYWPAATREHVRLATRADAPWACLFESFAGPYHAQSFFLALSADVLFSDECRRFWRRYRPYSVRLHAIRRGEIGISRALVGPFGKPYCLFSGSRLVQALLDVPEADAAAVLALNGAEFGRAKAARAATAGRLDRDQVLRRVAALALEYNPTHSLVIAFNTLMAAPVKRDVGIRRTLDIGYAQAALKGFEPAELSAIEADLRAGGTPANLSLGDRLLAYTGRI